MSFDGEYQQLRGRVDIEGDEWLPRGEWKLGANESRTVRQDHGETLSPVFESQDE